MIPAGRWTIAAPRARARSCRELGPEAVPYSMVWAASCGGVKGSLHLGWCREHEARRFWRRGEGGRAATRCRNQGLWACRLGCL